MGTHSILEGSYRRGDLTLDDIRETYQAKLALKVPLRKARCAALRISERNYANVQLFMSGKDTNGDPLAAERKAFFDAVDAVFREVESGRDEQWARLASKLEIRDPYKAMRILMPDYLNLAEDHAKQEEFTQVFDQVMAKVQADTAQAMKKRLLADGVDKDTAAEVVAVFVDAFQEVTRPESKG